MKRMPIFLSFLLVLCLIPLGCEILDEGGDEAPPAGKGTLSVTVTYNGDFGEYFEDAGEIEKLRRKLERTLPEKVQSELKGQSKNTQNFMLNYQLTSMPGLVPCFA